MHAHLITSINAPGLNVTMEKLARTGAAAVQLLILSNDSAHLGHEGGSGGNVGDPSPVS